MCQAFAKVADLAVDDERRYPAIMDWIEIQNKELSLAKPSLDSNTISQYTVPSRSCEREHQGSEIVKDKTGTKEKTNKRPIGGTIGSNQSKETNIETLWYGRWCTRGSTSSSTTTFHADVVLIFATPIGHAIPYSYPYLPHHDGTI
ncbi:uncharacterized protein LOC111403663 isoform X1 [Olea europaea var. sylvestris]|uniref:uncharacterized protein LOC111403663 isoform X1 n=1 Tax=Olea europaea var. sylvestris TaxID=158386 RepID=UPI000C1CDF02|nr:uncharacterized protein LOC111403663 isoform X1 [Olea europaea var. sylvestris]